MAPALGVTHGVPPAEGLAAALQQFLPRTEVETSEPALPSLGLSYTSWARWGVSHLVWFRWGIRKKFFSGSVHGQVGQGWEHPGIVEVNATFQEVA